MDKDTTIEHTLEYTMKDGRSLARQLVAVYSCDLDEAPEDVRHPGKHFRMLNLDPH